LPLLEDILLNKEKLCYQIADQKIKELLNKFIYIEDKIIFNQDNFYSLFKQNNNINLNIPQNNLQFDNMIRKVSKIKSEEYNNILVPKKPKWAKKKEEMSLRISGVCNNYINQIFKNQQYKENIKYDINNLEKLINALNLSNGIEEKKHNEIKILINQMKEKTNNQIINLKNNLPSWSEIKNSLINKGKNIIIKKIESNIPTNDLNKIVNILIEEVKKTPKFCDLLKDKNQYNQVFDELRKIAEQFGKNYINKKIKEEAQKKENEKKINEIKNKVNEQVQKKNKLEKEVEKMKKQLIEERKRKEQEERKRKEQEERNRKEQEIRKRKEHQIRIRKPQEIRRMEEESRRRREEEQRRRMEEESRRRREEEQRRRMEEEIRRRREEEQRRRMEEEIRRRRWEEARRREEEARRRREEEAKRNLYFPKPNYSGCSIVDGLNSIGATYSYAYRCTIAAKNGISGYVGSPEQNTHMLNLLKNGILLRP